MFSLSADSEKGVGELEATIIRNAGATAFFAAQTHQSWMYGMGFRDLNGHRWNVLYMDMAGCRLPTIDAPQYGGRRRPFMTADDPLTSGEQGAFFAYTQPVRDGGSRFALAGRVARDRCACSLGASGDLPVRCRSLSFVSLVQ
jgi:hypothetical protein